ncbi:MAG: OsmC family protein [Rhodobacteraceae bacterium]|jgi:uncharacterized OsmC-like protein|nr:OsmC family protein [Paracoccaceae bacterium]
MATVVEKQDFTKPIIRRRALTAVNDGSLATRVDFGDVGSMTFDEPSAHGGTDLGPTPLTGVLAALCGCEAVTFSRTAQEFGFAYDGIRFDAAFTIDIRGRSGMRGVVPHFQSVKVEAHVLTQEPEARLREVVDETEARCPVYNLIKDAGVRLEVVWIRDDGSTTAGG